MPSRPPPPKRDPDRHDTDTWARPGGGGPPRVGLLWLMVALAAVCWGCSDGDPEGARDDFADAGAQPDAVLADQYQPDLTEAPDVQTKICTDDSHCQFHGVCDFDKGVCIDCRTDQDCAPSSFCIDSKCIADVCMPGETRCYGVENVAMCKANGGGWNLSPCPDDTFCEHGKCVPLNCKPGSRTCDADNVVQCDEHGVQYEQVEDCTKTQQICLQGACKEKGCAAGDIQCGAVASGPAALICADPQKGLSVQACADTDPCTYDLCQAGQGCHNPPKPDGIACGNGKWCYAGKCTARTSNLVIMFDTSGSMSFKVPGKQCWEQTWPNCLPPHKQCSRMGVAKSVFGKALALIDETTTQMAMFHFPQLVLAPGQKLSPKPPYFAPPEPTCSRGRYMGYLDMTGHAGQQVVEPDSTWYWSALHEILAADFPTSATVTSKAEMLRWMDGVEEYGLEPEMRASGGTPIGKTMFYVGEYIRNRIVIDGKPCKVDADCANPNYSCDGATCKDPMRDCRETTLVIFTDGGELNKPNLFFSPWVQAKRLGYGLHCQTDGDCVGGAKCRCPPDKPACATAFKRCEPDEPGTGYYCRTTMKPCLPEAQQGEIGFCPLLSGLNACAVDPIGDVSAYADNFERNVLRSFDGKPFAVRVHVVDISEQPWGIDKSANIARSGGGLLLASKGENEDEFLKYLLKAFDVGAKPACGLKSVTCTGKQAGECDDGDPCTKDECSDITKTCVHKTNLGGCDDGDPCTLGERCLGGKCEAGIISVTTIAGSGIGNNTDGPAMKSGFHVPRGLTSDGKGGWYLTDHNRLRHLSAAGQVTTLLGTFEPGLADGSSKDARLYEPTGLSRLNATDELFIADRNNHRVRMYKAGQLSTHGGSWKGYAEGPANTAKFNFPEDVLAAPTDGAATLFVADRGNRRLRKIDVDGIVSTVVGTGTAGMADGPGEQAQLGSPAALAMGPGGEIYIADNHRLRRYAKGVITTIAGGEVGFKNGTGANARFDGMAGIAVAVDGTVYIADGKNHRVRKVRPDGAVTTLAGGFESGYRDGFGSVARFANMGKLTLAPGGRLLVVDTDNYRLRAVQLDALACPVGGECNVTTCDAKTGQCKAEQAPDGTPCEGDSCTAKQTCIGLKCAGGVPNDCDDGKLCTDDSCDAKTGGCRHIANKVTCDDGEPCTEADTCSEGKCAGKNRVCDDGDKATVGVCYLGSCFYQASACTTDAECTDGEAVCTQDVCEAGKCVYKATGAPGCCAATPWSNSFETVNLAGMTFVNSMGPALGWQIFTQLGTPPLSALYYGDPKTGTYAFTGASKGTATTPVVNLPVGRKASLSLWLWMQTEGGRLFDALRIEVLAATDGAPSASTMIWEKTAALQLASWETLTLDLSAWAGQSIRVRIVFDTVDELKNDTFGVMVDNMRIDVDCTK